MNEKEYLLVCSCSGQREKAETAYKLLYPEKELPEVIKGNTNVADLASRLHNEHIKAISKIKVFSYYVKLSENGEIIEEYDLTTGRKIK